MCSQKYEEADIWRKDRRKPTGKDSSCKVIKLSRTKNITSHKLLLAGIPGATMMSQCFLRPKRLTNGGQWCDHLLGLVPKTFPSCTSYEGERKEYTQARVACAENIFLSLNSSMCFSVKLE
ncbi:hypothetical protein VULLAG_LOCUS12618 [Vulpes lagopus]